MSALLGSLGHLFLITAWVASGWSAISYFIAHRQHDETWKKFSRLYFWVHALSVIGAVVVLFIILFGNYFEYQYAFQHSAREVAWYYKLACFWEGQEGSFLLWLFWQSVLGIVLLYRNSSDEPTTLFWISLVQVFLTSLIVGVSLGSLTIGHSPFLLLSEHPDFVGNMPPDFIPPDGNGLNPLLQNYWMVIHPPTLFLGFALSLIPLAFALSGLWRSEWSDWVRPALWWTVLGSAVLGLGILMGGYWAYETLSFGGYWNWDPVENAVYVPWLTMIASLHTLMLHQSGKKSLRLSIGLIITTFILIWYSTFLTRSGILGDASVHSFTDLGLSGHLLIILFFLLLLFVALFMYRWKAIPHEADEPSYQSREFWIGMGALALCLMSAQVILPTSIPVWNKLLNLFSIESKLALPADQVKFYSDFQLWFAVAIALLSGTAQYFWWKPKNKNYWILQGLFSALLFLVLLLLFNIYHPTYLILLLAVSYLLVANVFVFSRLYKTITLSGGVFAHAGIALMILGVLLSSGYSNTISLNQSGLLISKNLPTEFNRTNLLLFLHEPRPMKDYVLEYQGEKKYCPDKKLFIPKNKLVELEKGKWLVRKHIEQDGQVLFHIGDTLAVEPENSYYQIDVRKNEQLVATLFPRVQVNPSMGKIASPDIMKKWSGDIYTHVSLPKEDSEEDWSEWKEIKVKMDSVFFVQDYVTKLVGIKPVKSVPGLSLSSEDLAMQADIRIQGKEETYSVFPYFLIVQKNQVGYIADEAPDLGIQLKLTNIQPTTETFTIAYRTRQKDWVVIKAIEKPWINILWFGALLMTFGFSLSLVRRKK